MKTRETRCSVVLASFLLLTGLGFECSPQSEPTEPFFVSLKSGTRVQVCDLTIRVEPDRSVDPESVAATLNGVPLELLGGPAAFAVDLDATQLIYGDNTLVVSGALAGGGAGVSESVVFGFEGRARARRITDPADLLTGPLAHGRVGDYLLENCIARFVIQDVGQRDMYSVGAFGGNLIDAELRGHPGLESFLELQPMLNIETVVNAQSLFIVNGGSRGAPAMIKTCGPDDLLDFVNPSTSAGSVVGFPELADDRDLEIEACTAYSLARGDRFVRLETTVSNHGAEDLPLFVGDWINGGGELEQWTKPGAGLGQGLFDELQVFSFVGFGQARGVDYAYAAVPLPEFPDQPANYFSDSGISVILHNLSIVEVILGGIDPFPFVVPAGGNKSFTRYFAVGDGSGSNATDFEHEIRGTPVGVLEGCVTIGGVPAPDARVSVGVQEDGTGPIEELISFFDTDESGCFSGTLPVGSFAAAAAKPGTPFEGGGPTPPLHPFTISEGASTSLPTLALPPTGRLRVAIRDALGRPLPGRATVVGFDPSPQPTTPGTTLFPGFSSGDLGLFFDPSDTLPFGVVAFGYANADGLVAFDVEPGSYQLFVSRGTEYSLFETAIQIQPDEMVSVDAQIARVIETPGFVSSDFHVHGVASHDARVNDRDRVLQFAGEGIENPTMTDHHVHTDLTPTIAALGMEAFLRSTIGEEITTADYGHYNAYPLTIDPDRPSRGSTDWGGAAPPGMDFPSFGAFSATPAEIDALARTGPQSTADTVVQINHIGSHFEPLAIDTTLVPPRSLLTHAEALALRLPGDAGDPDSLGFDFFHDFEALELWNGSGRGAQAGFIQERLGIWFNLLNQGITPAAVFDTDTHTFTNLRTAGARTWTASPTDAPALIEAGNVSASVRAGRAVGGQGVYLQTRLLAGDGSGNVADFSWDGSTLVTSANGRVDLQIDVQAPSWAPYRFITIYANAATTPASGEEFLHGAIPSRILLLGRDFAIDEVVVDPGIPGATRLETRDLVVPFEGLTEDTWFVVLVRGFANLDDAMFPVYPADLDPEANTTLADLLDGNRGEDGVLALGVTNALYADLDEEPGFQAPLAP
jgi:hypothetical protein